MITEANLSFELSGLQITGPDMLVDEYDQYNHDRHDVVDISPDGASEEPAEVEPMADDCTCDCVPALTSSYHVWSPRRCSVLFAATSLPQFPAHASLQEAHLTTFCSQWLTIL